MLTVYSSLPKLTSLARDCLADISPVVGFKLKYCRACWVPVAKYSTLAMPP